MQVDHAETANIEKLISRIGAGLDQFLKFEHADCLQDEAKWRGQLDLPLPSQGVGINRVIDDLVSHVIPYGSVVPKPGLPRSLPQGQQVQPLWRPLLPASPHRNAMG